VSTVVVHSSSEPQVQIDDGYLSLRATAELFEDFQKTRIAAENRIGRAPIDAEVLAASMGHLKDAEHQMGLVLRRTFRRVVEAEIIGWQAETIGVGEHMLARLLGAIGHPVRMRRHAWEDDVLVLLEERDRTVSELWSYCGHGDPTRRPKRGISQEDAFRCGNPKAKMIVHLMAEACLKAKARSPYGPVYDDARVHYMDREGWTPLHQHNAALRKVGKEILRDLWVVAR
jgi:hypothetical protein